MFKKIIVAITLTLLTMQAQAVVQGTLNPTSTGSFDVTVTIPNEVRITGLADVDFGTYPATGNLDSNYDLCIYSNMPGATYDITASGDGAGSAFTIAYLANTIPYVVNWNDTTGTVGKSQLTATVSVPQTGANQQTTDCSVGGDSANLEIEINGADISGKPNGTYTGTLTLLIEAN